MLPWLFHIYVGVAGEANTRVLGTGLTLLSEDGRVECKLAPDC